MAYLTCPHCNESRPGLLWSDSVSWGCHSCSYYETAYSGPSFPVNHFGISEEDDRPILADRRSEIRPHLP